MSKIIRTEPNAILSKAVDYHGFVFLQGCTAKDPSQECPRIDGHNRSVPYGGARAVRASRGCQAS